MNYAIILSGGIGTRMNNLGCPKQYYNVNGKMILEYTLEVFEKTTAIDRIILVMAEEWRAELHASSLSRSKKITAFANPGRNRQESILHGLKECVNLSDSNNDMVIIHDAVRPCVSIGLINRCIESLSMYDGCMPVLPMKDTVYQSKDGTVISGLLNRSEIYAGQAPEAYLLHKYYEANIALSEEKLLEINGSTEAAFKYGLNICMIPGEESNFKITTQEDLRRFTEIVGG